jgi:myo-inositol 2-dehydrogenase / D-chiro-inositol 1-dehydrogenase
MRVGVIGAGWIALEHVAVLRGLDDVELVGVCDLDPGRCRLLAPEVTAYTDWEELVAGEAPDAVFVCVPPLAHRDVAIGALERGIHVYLEKPIARDLADGRAIVAAAAASDAVCAVGYQWRALDVLPEVRAAIDGQEIALLIGISTGPTRSRPWFLDRRQGGGNVLERGSHQIDLERAVAGEVVAVQATTSTVALAQSGCEHGDIEDAAALVLQFASGAIGTIQVAWTRDGLPGAYSLDVLASDASLHLALDPDFTVTGRSRGLDVGARSTSRPLDRSIVRFLEAARQGDRDRVFCSPADAVGTLAVAVACEEALAAGGTVSVPRVS